MKKVHATIVAGLLAAAAALGMLAATRTVSLGATQTRAGDARIAAQAARLDRFEASLRRALAKTPPPLPAVPKTPVPQTAAPAAAAPRVVYRRPPAIVVVHHARHGDDEHEHEGGDD